MVLCLAFRRKSRFYYFKINEICHNIIIPLLLTTAAPKSSLYGICLLTITFLTYVSIWTAFYMAPQSYAQNQRQSEILSGRSVSVLSMIESVVHWVLLGPSVQLRRARSNDYYSEECTSCLDLAITLITAGSRISSMLRTISMLAWLVVSHKSAA